VSRAASTGEGKRDSLSAEQIDATLGDLEGWTCQGGALTRTFRLAGFARAVDFVELGRALGRPA